MLNLVNMRSLKERGWKPTSNDTFQSYNIYTDVCVAAVELILRFCQLSIKFFS